MGHSESSPRRKIHSITGLPSEIRKVSNIQSNLTPKGTKKKNKAQSEQKEGNNKDQSGNK